MHIMYSLYTGHLYQNIYSRFRICTYIKIIYTIDFSFTVYVFKKSYIDANA